ncbi:hypothetical protein YH65_08570 [Sulfurovum lithotrophicum]|uniref:DUF2868 domain-containing protein n=1 Tax=Sulfurovum lithotrophicum TaxID=206403 RepID=A0A7U4M2B8_9BACT|nr:DUF2868 domain-containing protein [Sulfurovum lithotrophicum]AKF25429.1 hypothetical protein YH65_08570 [Sulfurovum lithotrophicum]
MNLASYLDLYALLQTDKSTREEKRAFGLEHEGENPFKLLLLWTQQHRGCLKKPLLSETVTGYLYGTTLILGVVAFFLGLFSGLALLSYSGHEPVNVVYFMAMVILLPIITMTLALFSMLRANASRSFLVHISPAYWMEKVLRLLPGKVKKSLDELQVNPSILNWLVIRRSQLLALIFSIGLLVALLGMVVTKDIAFAWSTTLHVSAQEFHALLETVALPWKSFFPTAVPSLELIEKSQYFRLGEKLDPEMVRNASELGEWWKFLAFATLFYAIILRFFMWMISVIGYRRALKRSFLNLDGAQALLRSMSEPLITTSSPKTEEVFKPKGNHYVREVETFDSSYDLTLGWAMSHDDLVLLNDAMKITSPLLEDVGGTNTLDEDREIVLKAKGEVLFYVKAWEPPTMDFVDFLEDLSKVADRIIVAPVGIPQNGYLPKQNELAMWGRKLQGMGEEKVWLKI